MTLVLAVIGMRRRRFRGVVPVEVDQDDRPDRGRAGDEALRAGQARRRQPDRLQGRGGLPGEAADAGAALQAVADLRREEVPVGAGAGGRDRRGDRAGRPAAADRRQERRLQAGVRQLLTSRAVHQRRRAEGRAAHVALAGHVAARSTRSRSWSSPRARSTACRCRPISSSACAARAACCAPRRSASRRNSCGSW